ncbi:LuxR C-terminal-related transcriptional regulator [Glaciecola siphonariae]|uniref:LuxR C-terminal-related transcriptional regulator n=1 Tax=Glaciecola siphonariae TaxID=521012 RepID=A0ABV9LXZ3_9ALTE
MSFFYHSEVLSKREKQIAEKILEGLPNKVIGAELFISERTVKFHCHNIYRKLDIRSRHALVAKYYRDMAGSFA